MHHPTSLTKPHTIQENTFFIIWNLLKLVFASKIVNCGRFQVLSEALLSIKCYGIWCCVTGQVLLNLSKDPDCLTLKTKALPSFEMSRSTHPTTQQCHIPEELNVLLEFWGCIVLHVMQRIWWIAKWGNLLLPSSWRKNNKAVDSTKVSLSLHTNLHS